MRYMDMLAKLGVGSAHPGGFSATMELLGDMPIAKESRILDVGCGTGRTACHLAKQGYEVTAADIHGEMLEKANIRAKLEDVKVRFVEANVEKLPFEHHSFDVILGESVTIFADSRQAIGEYYRVLATGGMLLDREMITIKPLTERIAKKVGDYYGAPRVWSELEWRSMLMDAGFKDIELLKTGVFSEIDWQAEMDYPDAGSVVDPAVYFNERIWELTREYDALMSRYGGYFGYGVWKGIK